DSLMPPPNLQFNPSDTMSAVRFMDYIKSIARSLSFALQDVDAFRNKLFIGWAAAWMRHKPESHWSEFANALEKINDLSTALNAVNDCIRNPMLKRPAGGDDSEFIDQIAEGLSKRLEVSLVKPKYGEIKFGSAELQEVRKGFSEEYIDSSKRVLKFQVCMEE